MFDCFAFLTFRLNPDFCLWVFLNRDTQDHLPRDGVTHSGLGLPTSINNQDSPPQANLIWVISCGSLSSNSGLCRVDGKANWDI